MFSLVLLISWCEIGVQLYSLAGEYPVAPAPSVEKTVFTAMYYLLSLVKYQLIIFIGVWGNWIFTCLKKMNLDLDFILIMKINSEWIIDLKAKCKPTKHLEDDRGEKPIQP